MQKKWLWAAMSIAAIQIAGCESEVIVIGDACKTCSADELCCDGRCTDVTNDKDYCGSCDIACGENEYCGNGTCKPGKDACGGCKDGLKCCGTTCVDTDSDAENCGKCGVSCDSGVCEAGQCACTPVTCEELNKSCGIIDDGCGNELDCGSCDECTPKSCEELGKSCGKHDDGCGNTLDCGTCSEDCTPKTCEELGQSCGKHDDGCGNTLDCGACECKPKTCTDLGQSCGKHDDGCGNTIDCGKCPEDCKPKTCAELGKNCGEISDGCDGKLQCGSCTAPQTCQENVCKCTPTTCKAAGKNCGEISDGCGGKLQCGTCASGQTCQDNVCKCTPTTCKAAGKNCGEISDGCGGKLQCGTCASGQTCQSNVCKCTPTTCAAAGKNCGEISDGCGGKLQCGTCASGQTCQSNVCKGASIKDTYPKRQSIKGLQPDFMSRDEVVGNGVHGVAFNFVWQAWQPSQTGSCGAGQYKYDGYCFNIDGNTEAAIKDYTNRGVVVTAVIYGPPAWARRSCDTSIVTADYFCAPTSEGAKHYGRFVGFIANYFNGENGHGRVADFVIHNEVNASEWFNYGCKAGTCNVDTWTTVYAESYNNAYDYAVKEQKSAKVLISLEHNWTQGTSLLSRTRPVVGGEYFLQKLIPKLGNRDWRIAYHSYPPNLLDPAFGADDYNNSGTITFGNIGVLAGWLRKNYPNDPHAWEIQLTENGINGNGSSMQTKQRSQLCQAFRNILGTPGVESFIYHRLVDHPAEGSLQLGLWAGQSNGHPNPAKPAWELYALANRSGVGSGWPSCGFEYLPYIKMTRGAKSNMHWITTRQLPSGFSATHAWKILREPAENTKLYYECRVGGAKGGHAMISPDANCEGQFNMGPLGYIYQTQVSGTSPIYRCHNASTGSHFVSSDSGCEGATKESLVGYAHKL